MVFEVPFNSARKYHLRIIETRHTNDGNTEYLLLMKVAHFLILWLQGAPEILIKKCSHILSDHGPIPLDQLTMQRFQSAYEGFAEDGRRVIGFVETRFVASSSIKFSSDAGNFPTDNLVFLGMCAIMDPPRDETAGNLS